jgi:methylmalonyl-CoA/ethylmalonyl-CoA epimerase
VPASWDEPASPECIATHALGGTRSGGLGAVETEGVQTAFYLTGASKIELLESMQPDGVISRFIEQKGEGLHHIAFEVPDIRAEMSRLKAAGFRLLSDEPKRGADNKWVCFVHPKSAGGVLVELCEEIKK